MTQVFLKTTRSQDEPNIALNMSVPDEGDSRNALYSLNQISTFLLLCYRFWLFLWYLQALLIAVS